MAREHYAIDLAAARRFWPRPWNLVLLAIGLAASVWTGLHVQSARVAQQAAEQTLARLQAALAERGAATRAAISRAPSAGERRLQADVSRLASDLYRPWFPLFDALEASAVPKVHLQALAVDAGFSKLQLQVDAPDLPELLQYVHALDNAGPPLLGAQLLGHEWQAAGGAPRRLQARINVALVASSTAALAPKYEPAGPAACGPGALGPCLSAKAAP
jgi:hypothetical protein